MTTIEQEIREILSNWYKNEGNSLLKWKDESQEKEELIPELVDKLTTLFQAKLKELVDAAVARMVSEHRHELAVAKAAYDASLVKAKTMYKAEMREFAISELEKLEAKYVLAPGGNHYVGLDDIKKAIKSLKEK